MRARAEPSRASFIAAFGGLASDGPVADEFTSGWALHPFVGERAHYWTRHDPKPTPGVRYGLTRACRPQEWTVETDRTGLVGSGNWPRCQLCEKVLP